MKRSCYFAVLVFAALFSSVVSAAVTATPTGFRISYDINLSKGTSNGSDIQDTLIFEWNDAGDFSVTSGSTIAGRGRTVLDHVIDFEPTAALVMGWGAAVPGVGDEKDHIFTLVRAGFAEAVTGLKWSAAFPGVPPLPRTGHSDMTVLLQAAASGDTAALAAVEEFVRREGGSAAFNPANSFRVLEWSTAVPIDPPLQVPVMPAFALWAVVLGLVLVARGFIRRA
jgi:hypothetical protein